MSWFKADMDTHTAPPSGMGEKIGRAKMRKLVGREKTSLKGKAKATHKSKAKQGIHSWLPMDRQVLSHAQESRVPSAIKVT